MLSTELSLYDYISSYLLKQTYQDHYPHHTSNINYHES